MSAESSDPFAGKFGTVGNCSLFVMKDFENNR